jgi:DNA topoisomerase-2
MTSKTLKTKYSKINPIDHILLRPDMYTGSTRSRNLEEYITESQADLKIIKKNISFSPAILRIFIETLSNAIDNVERSKNTETPCTKIKISVDIETGKASIWNDGLSIPIEYNEEEKCYNHTLIFGQLLTSSNYDDTQERYNVSGRNGLGGKLCNVFSNFFSVEGLDPNTKQYFSQEWSNNMKTVNPPVIKSSKISKGYTKVSWIPDFKQFEIEKYSTDLIDLYHKYSVDASMLTGVNVYFNGVLIPVSTMHDYSKLYNRTEEFDEKNVIIINTKDHNVVISESSYFQTVSFANGVYTSLGGTHIDAWSEAAFRPIVKKLMSVKNGPVYTIADVKKYFKIFVHTKVINPEFESQSKNKLESPVKACITTAQTNAMLKWSVIEDIKKSKEIVALKKLERKKKNFVKIEGLDPANNEGTKLSTECTLILVEGLAAKTYAVKGIEVGAFGKSGRDWFGIYALRGKLLNVRNSNTESISKNAVISDIIKSLGASVDSDYNKDSCFSNLRYGRILIITDQDVDGIHISGLIQNMFHSLFPTLLERKQSFITSMQTPIVRIFDKKKDILFYDEREYKKYVKNYNTEFPGKSINQKYYKGLGSSSDQDIADTFGIKMINIEKDSKTDFNMHKVFHKTQADARKNWLEKYNEDNVSLIWDEGKKETVPLSISNFLNTELIKFSLNDCKRSLPGMMDGLKEGNRKVLYACFLRNLKYTGKSLKVAQLAGYVAEHAGYHHGEQNLYDTITRMGNSFQGCNNIPLLYRDGQYGTRLSGGKDAANARYIFTKLDGMTRLLFRPEDDILLERVIEDGDIVEPVYYVPILPTILINGCVVGIGTGYSCSVPCYNPLDLVKYVKDWLDKDSKDEYAPNNLTPWYRGFTGDIIKSNEQKHTSWGRVSTQKKGVKVVEELPIGLWTDNFKDFLDELQQEKIVKKVKNYSTPKNVNFVITEDNDGMICNKETLKLYKYIYTSNMVLYDENGNIKKYKDTNEIIDSFCKVRMTYYIKRKKYQLDVMKHDIKFLGNKKRFLSEVLSGEMLLFDTEGTTRSSRKLIDMVLDLKSKGYDKDDKEKYEEDEGKTDSTGGYGYLLRLQFRSITKEKINSLENDINTKQKAKDYLEGKNEKELWISDLNDFEKEYTKWIKVIEKEVIKKKK